MRLGRLLAQQRSQPLTLLDLRVQQERRTLGTSHRGIPLPRQHPAGAHSPVMSTTAQPAAEEIDYSLAEPEPTNTLAILAIIFAFFFWPLGMIFGHSARAQMNRTGEYGWGMAGWALFLSYLWGAATVAFLIDLLVRYGSSLNQ